MFQIKKTNIVLDKDIKKARNEAESKISNLWKAIAELEEIKSNHEKDVSKLKDLSAEKEGLELEIRDLRSDVSDIKKDISTLELYKEDIKRENSILANERRELEVIISRLRDEIENRKKDLSNYKDKNSDAWDKLRATKKEIEVNVSKIEELKEEQKKIEEDNESLSILLSAHQRALDKKKEDIKGVELEISEILNKRDSLISQNNKLIKESEDIKRKSEEMLSKADLAYFKWVEDAKKDSLLIVNNAKEQADKELSSIAVKFNELLEERKKFEEERDIAKWEISEKTRWLSEKEVRLREIKNKLESFYGKKIDNIII